MVSGLVLYNETLVADHALEDNGLFDGPCADVRPLLLGRLVVLLLGVRGLPSCLPVICELLEERCLERRRLLGKAVSLVL